MKSDRLNTILIVLIAAALALGVLTYFVIFYPTGTYQPVVSQGSSNATSTASSTLNIASSTANSATSTVTGTASQFSSAYTYPYPVTWNEGHESFAVTGASMQNNQLTLSLSVQMGNTSECVPINVRLVADEYGTLQLPSSPTSNTFPFPDSQTCNGTPNATYSESLTFMVTNASTTSPYLFTTGGTSNIFFTLATSTTGGVDIALPSTSG